MWGQGGWQSTARVQVLGTWHARRRGSRIRLEGQVLDTLCLGDFISLSALFINVNFRSQGSFFGFWFFNISGSLYLTFPLSFSPPFTSANSFFHSGSSPALTPTLCTSCCHPTQTRPASLRLGCLPCVLIRFSCLSSTTSLDVKFVHLCTPVP